MELVAYALRELEVGFEQIAASVPPPARITIRGRHAYRYKERTSEQAVVLKLARLISCVRAGMILLENGMDQELGILQRAMDETDEDIHFLCGPKLGGELTARHAEFLEYFFREEFREDGSHDLDRPSISRQKIMAYNARTIPGSDDPSRALSAARRLHKAFSGYAHGAAPHLIEFYGGNPPRFRLAGILGTSLHDGHVGSFANYPYRALMTAGMVASSFGIKPADGALFVASVRYGRASGLHRE
jgi:hypothetical protein